MKVPFIILAGLTFLIVHCFCPQCNAYDRLSYSLLYLFGVTLLWDVFFGENIFVSGIAFKRNQKGYWLLVLAVGSFFTTYSIFLFIKG